MEWQEIIIKIIGLALGALLTYAVARVSAMINSNIKDERLKNCLQTSLQIVTSAVKKTYQTYVDGIKGTDAWTAEAQKTALSMALDTCKAELSDDFKKYIVSHFGDLDEWLTSQIESALYDLKQRKSS